MITYLHWFRSKSVDSCETTDEETEGEKQEWVGQESIDSQDTDDNTIVSGEVTGIV